ncbi:MAG: hypothetical protein HY067_16620 [Betaproteobacteria bacterium]|nr:hypothetical protein [Betaproteobacteria bacterium]
MVASWSSDESLARCLSSLAPQWDGAEVIVATNRPGGELERRYSRVRFLRGPKGATVFRLRTLGADAACGRLVALLEDHAAAEACWAAALREAHRAGHRIIGGPVENGLQSRAMDWALYFVEYGSYMPPMRKGPAPRLSGLNIAYDHELLHSCREVWEDTFQENEINDALRAKGHALHLAPDAVVESFLPMSLGYAMGHLRDGGRHFARYRASRCSRTMRLVWALASPLVPAVLFLRLVRGVASRRLARLGPLVRALPFLALVLGAWGWGEATGYFVGGRER